MEVCARWSAPHSAFHFFVVLRLFNNGLAVFHRSSAACFSDLFFGLRRGLRRIYIYMAFRKGLRRGLRRGFASTTVPHVSLIFLMFPVVTLLPLYVSYIYQMESYIENV